MANISSLLVLSAIVCLGCNNDRVPDHQGALDKTNAAVSDEVLARDCINGWLSEQQKARRGEKYFDAYVTTPLDAPNLSEYAKRSRDTTRLLQEGPRMRNKFAVQEHVRFGEPLKIEPPNESESWTTINNIDDINAVRQWEILNLELIDFDRAQQEKYARQKQAKSKVRIESSKDDGTPIIKVWQIDLFKDNGKWGIHMVFAG